MQPRHATSSAPEARRWSAGAPSLAALFCGALLAFGSASEAGAPGDAPGGGADAASASEAAKAPAPRIEIEERRIDAGRVRQGEKVAADFVVRNRGEAELRILRAKPS